MRGFDLTTQATADLEAIRAYIARDSVAAADAFVDRLLTKMRLLAETPGIGSPRDDVSPGLRGRSVGWYLILYRTVEGRVTVVRVVHGAQDPENLLPG